MLNKKKYKKIEAAENFFYPVKNSRCLISDADLWILSYYRSSELTGSILMGKMARRTKDDELRSRLTWHFAEEARHAWRWTELIRKLGANPLPITETYQSNYFTQVGVPKDDLELIAITQVFERRVASHLIMHRNMQPLDQHIKEILTIMTHDEGPHLGWGLKKLREFAKFGRAREVDKKLKRFSDIDKRVYLKEAKKFLRLGWKLPKELHDEIEH